MRAGRTGTHTKPTPPSQDDRGGMH